MGADIRKSAERSIPEFDINDAAGILAKLHERLKKARSRDITLTEEETSAISAAASFMSIAGPGPKKPKPPV